MFNKYIKFPRVWREN